MLTRTLTGARFLAAITLMLLTASLANAETIVGRFRYLDSDQQFRPIAHAKVEVWTFQPRFWFVWLWGKVAEVQTDANGFVHHEQRIGVRDAVVALRVHASNYAAVVWPNDNVPIHLETYWTAPLANGKPIEHKVRNGNDRFDFTCDFTGNWEALHFNLAETVRHGFDYVASRRDPNERDSLPRADVQPTSWIGSWFNPGIDRIHQTVVINNDDVWNDLVVLHEYGHLVNEEISSMAFIASIHNGCYASHVITGALMNSAEQAFLEGFADFFAQAVARHVGSGVLHEGGNRRYDTYYLERGRECVPMVLANIPHPKPEEFEWRVASVLYDLLDQRGDPDFVAEQFDEVDRADRLVMEILDRELDVQGRWPTLRHFHDAWVKRGADHRKLDRIAEAYGIVFHAAVQTPDPPVVPPNQTWPPYGAVIRLRHELTNCQLHSHPFNYGHNGSSRQQQVTCFHGRDDNDDWIIKGPNGEGANYRLGQAIRHGDIVRLEHRLTGRNLHSHGGHPSPVTRQQEVTAFGAYGNGDGGDNWRVELESGAVLDYGVRFRLIHVDTNHALHSHAGYSHAQWTRAQQEVTGFGGRDGNDVWILLR